MTPPRSRELPWGWTSGSRRFLVAVGLAIALVQLARVLAVGEGQAPHAQRFSLDPDSASERVLVALPQVGPSRARAIVEARRGGPYRSIEDLQARVRGIGPATAAVLGPYLRFPARDANAITDVDLR